MGPVGVPEMIVIFLVALVLFGPKKLPELGRTLGKAISEFRRAQSELKATFNRELQNLERETESQNEIGGGYRYDNYNYDYSSGAGNYGEPSNSPVAGPGDSTVTNTSTTSASATEGAESLPPQTPEGTVAHGTEMAADSAVNPPGQMLQENSEPRAWSLEKELADQPSGGVQPVEHNA
jgi:sec-independent protein translocase protein TatA